MQLALQHCYKTSWKPMLRVLHPRSNLFCNKSGCCSLRKLLGKVESRSPFCIFTCCAFYPPNSRVTWSDSGVILSNQKSVFTHLVVTWFVARQVWTRGSIFPITPLFLKPHWNTYCVLSVFSLLKPEEKSPVVYISRQCACHKQLFLLLGVPWITCSQLLVT